MRRVHLSPSAALGWGSGKGSQRGDGSFRRERQNQGGGGERRRPQQPPSAPRPRPRSGDRPPPDPFSGPSSYSSDPYSFEHTGRFFATCHPGLESFVADELSSSLIGASGVEPGRGGVHFRGSAATCYAANLWLRCAIRVLHLIGEGSIAPSRYRGGGGGSYGDAPSSSGRLARRGERGGDRLYALTRRACDWASLLPSSPSSSSPGTISVEARVGACTDVAGSRLAATVVRDAVCDAVRDATGRRPPPPSSEDPRGASVDLPIFVAAHRDVVWLYRDTSGDSLHRRGYRTNSRVHAAALNESAAAGVLAAAGWSRRVDAAERSGGVASLVDPMCGSGTLLIEAALAATRTAPGLPRTRWPFLRWRDFDQGLWRSVREEASRASRRDGGGGKRPFYLAGRDCHEGALSLARRGAFEAGVDHLIDFDLGSCASWSPSVPSSGKGSDRPTLVVTNPPWGRRLLGATSRFDSPALSRDGTGVEARDRRHRRAAVDDDGERVRPWYDGGADGDCLEWDSPALSPPALSPPALSTPALSTPRAEGDDDGGDVAPSTPPSPVSSPSLDPESSEQALELAWRDLGRFLRESASPGEAYVVCGNRDASRHLRMKVDRKWPLTAGGCDVRVLRYEVLPPLKREGGEEGGGRRAREDSGVVVR